MQIIEDRRALHAIAELGSSLPKTLDYLRLKLAFLSCSVFSPTPGSLCAWFDFGASSALAFRCRTDALPLPENTGLPFASRHAGKMHAGGNDGHMAMLLELARRLAGKKCSKNILLVFQPGGDAPNGAKELCLSGVFKQYRVESVFGLQLWPGLSEGVIASRKKELLSRSCELSVDIIGRSAHIAQADEGLDALAAGVEFYNRAKALEQSLPDQVYRLLTFSRMESGTSRNAVAAHTRMAGSLRTFQDDVYNTLRSGLTTIARELEETTGCTVRLTMNDGNPAVMNPADLFDRVRKVVPFRELAQPSMMTEDFGTYQRYLPGMLFFLGVGDTPALHTDTFDYNEDVLLRGADFLEALATK